MKTEIEEKNIYSKKKEKWYIFAQNLMYIYIILCPIFDMMSYLYDKRADKYHHLIL